MSRTLKNTDLPRLVRGRLRSGERGFVLIAVLWFGLGLSAVASFLLISAQFQARQAILSTTQARLATETFDAAANWTIAALESDDPFLTSNSDQPLKVTRAFGGRAVEITVVPREARVDLNLDDPVRIALAFEIQGVEGEMAMMLAARIVDFRDADDLRSINGAERAEYAAANLSGPRNGAFLVPEDLGRVLGVTPTVYEKVSPILSLTALPIAESSETRVTLTGNRFDPVGGRRASQSVRRPGIFIELSTEDGDRRSFAYFSASAHLNN